MNVYIGGAKDYSAMRGPCPDGFHVPLGTEIDNLYNMGVSLGAWSSTTPSNFANYIKLGPAGCIGRNGNLSRDNEWGSFLSSTFNTTLNDRIYSIIYNISKSALYTGEQYTSLAKNIRPFKDTPVIPDSSWTRTYSGTGTAGIYWNSTLGLISLSSDGINWLTIADKNLGATTVYSYGATLSEANCGKYYQWGNNYGFPFSGSGMTKSSNQVNAGSYGPGNYYNSSTFITRDWTPAGWDSSNNANLWGGVTGIVSPAPLKNAYIGEYKGWTPGSNTLAYLPLATDSNDHKGFSPIYNGYRNEYVSYSNNKAVFNSNGQGCITFNDGPTNNTFTLHMIAQITTLSGYQLAFRMSDSSGYDNCRCYLNGYGSIQLGMANGSDVLTGISADTNEHLYSWVVQNNQMKFYIDGVLKYTYSANVGSYSGAKLSLGNRWYNTNEGLKGTMREVILESSYRTDEEIANYYNQTKSKYGL